MSDEQEPDTTEPTPEEENLEESSAEATGEDTDVENAEAIGEDASAVDASETSNESLEAAVGGIRLYDFNKPGGLSADLDHCWDSWISAFASDFQEKWLVQTSSEVTLTTGPIISLPFDVAKTRIPKLTVGYEIAIGRPAVSTLLIMERALSVALILQMLGEAVEEYPEDRELSLIEHTLYEILIRKITTSLSEAWQQKDVLQTELGSMDLAPIRSRKYDPKAAILFATIEITICEQTKEVYWLLPQTEIEELLSVEDVPVTESSDSAKTLIQERARDIPVDVSVLLGNATLRVSQLADLEPGDVIVLDQKVSDPLPLRVADINKFFGWLGRTGNRQAFKVSEVA